LLLMTLQFIADAERPDRVVRVLVDAVPSGSYLVVSHPASDGGARAKVASQATARYNELVATPMTRRSRKQVARFFDGLEIIEPGLVAMSEWRPGPGGPPPSLLSPAHCAVARKPLTARGRTLDQRAGDCRRCCEVRRRGGNWLSRLARLAGRGVRRAPG